MSEVLSTVNQVVDKQTKDIIDFVYDKPQLVVPLLQKYGYSIEMKTASLQQIYELTFRALSIDQNTAFAQDLDDLIQNEGYLNIIPLAVMAGASIVSSVISGFLGSDAADKQREAMVKLKLAELASNEKLTYEQIRTQAETYRIGIIINSLTQNRKNLYEQGTKRLQDTWMYVLAFGLSVAVIYGITLVNSKNT